MELKVDVLPFRTTRPPILRCETRDHGQIEQERLACRALNRRNERRSGAFLARGFGVRLRLLIQFGLPSHSSLAEQPAFAQVGFGAASFTRFASEAWWARQDSNLQPDRYERPNIDQVR
jgi:hypothetical protein